MIHALGVGWEDALPVIRGNPMVGHQNPLLTEIALAEVLDRLINEQDTHLTSCTKTGSTSESRGDYRNQATRRRLKFSLSGILSDSRHPCPHIRCPAPP